MFGKNQKNDIQASGGLIYADTQPGESRGAQKGTDWRRLAVVMIAAVAVLTALAIALTLWVSVRRREDRYTLARSLAEEKAYAAAMAEFEALGDYRDSQAMLEELEQQQAAYEAAEALVDQQRYEEAVAAFRALGDYADSRMQADSHVTYRKAKDLMASTDAGETQLLNRILNARVRISDEGGYAAVLGYETAAALLESLGDYEDAAALADQCYDSAGRVKLQYRNWDGALAYLDRMSPEAASVFYETYLQFYNAANGEGQ